MKYREWMEQISKQKVELSEISESLYADGHSITVSIKPKGVEAEIDGKETYLGYLRPFFTHHKDEFAAMLESIVERCQAISVASEIATSVAAYDSIPEAVIERLKGNDPGGNVDLIRASLEKKARKELWKVLANIEPIFDEFAFAFPPFGDYEMELTKSGHNLTLQWGNSTIIYSRGLEPRSSITDNLTEMLLFVGNFELIKFQLADFYQKISQLPRKNR